MTNAGNRYQQLIERIFFDRFSGDDDEIFFEREDLESAADDIEIELPKNLGDVIYVTSI